MSEFINAVRGIDVLQDWDTFFDVKMGDYYTVKEEVVGEWFTLDGGVLEVEAEVPAPVLQAINTTKLQLVMRSIKRDIVVVGVVAGPNIKGNPYNLTKNQIFFVDIYDRQKGLYYTAPELIAFANKVSINPYGSTFTVGPVLGLADFKAAVQALNDDEDPTTVANEVVSSLNMLLNAPSEINTTIDRQGLIFGGLFGYTFNYRG